MGAVYVTGRLSNAIDLDMARQGLLEGSNVRTSEGVALVDTGATRSVIPPDIANSLGLGIYRHATGLFADGTRVSCGVCTGIRFEVDGRETLEDAHVMGDSVLIGQSAGIDRPPRGLRDPQGHSRSSGGPTVPLLMTAALRAVLIRPHLLRHSVCEETLCDISSA